MKNKYIIAFILLLVTIVNAQTEMQLSANLDLATRVSAEGEGGLYFAGAREVNFRFSQRIAPHGDCVDVINGYAFVTWYKGGIEARNLMLSRKNLNVPNSEWVTIEFPHRHIGIAGELKKGTGTRGDSHNTAAIGVSTLDNTIHILYDMHGYRSQSLPDDFFNYSISKKDMAFVPDSEFTLDIFNPKQNFLKQGESYERATYPMIHRADDGSLVARYREGGSGNGDILMAHYNGNGWSDNWLFQEGTTPLPNRNSYYGGERFINGKFYAGFSVRFANNNSSNPTDGYTFNSGLYYAFTNDIPKNQSSQWFTVDNQTIALPIRNNLDENLDLVKIGEPGDDFGTAENPRTTSDPSWTVTENGAIHFVTRVDNINVHYYKNAADSDFSFNSGGLIPNPEVRGELYSFNNRVFMVELINGKVNIKTTPAGENDWEIIYTGTESLSYSHFNAFVEGDKLYVYLMQTGNNTPGEGDKRPLYFQEFSLSEVEVEAPDTSNEPTILIEAEDFDIGGEGIGYSDKTPENTGGSGFREDEAVDIQSLSTASNGRVVFIFEGAEWLMYTFDVETAGIYDFVLSAANRNRDDSIMDIEINGELFRNVPITRTFDWEIFADNMIENISLNEGLNTVMITQRRSQSSTPDTLGFILRSALNTLSFEKEQIAVYPNPSKGVFNIKSKIKNLNYTLVNLQGQSLQNGKVSQNKIDFSGFSQGIYFLELTIDNSKLIKKIVIE